MSVVLVTDHPAPDTAIEARMLEAIGAELRVAPTGAEDELVEMAAGAVAILTCFKHVTPAVVRAASGLRVIGRAVGTVVVVDEDSRLREALPEGADDVLDRPFLVVAGHQDGYLEPRGVCLVGPHRDDLVLTGGRRGDKEMQPIAIPADKTYRWRVEEEFIAAIRGQEPVRRTSFGDAVNYMDFTEAVHISSREGRRVYLPLA